MCWKLISPGSIASLYVTNIYKIIYIESTSMVYIHPFKTSGFYISFNILSYDAIKHASNTNILSRWGIDLIFFFITIIPRFVQFAQSSKHPEFFNSFSIPGLVMCLFYHSSEKLFSIYLTCYCCMWFTCISFSTNTQNHWRRKMLYSGFSSYRKNKF